jgi:hypothetical protein
MADKTETAPAATLTPKDLAEKLSTDSKTVRRFLRKAHGDDAPGQGGRWSIPTADVTKLRKEFQAFQAAEADRKAKAAEAKAAKADEESDDEAETDDPKPERTADAVDAVIAAGGLPKAEAVKAAARKNRKAASEAARKPETATA